MTRSRVRFARAAATAVVLALVLPGSGAAQVAGTALSITAPPAVAVGGSFAVTVAGARGPEPVEVVAYVGSRIEQLLPTMPADGAVTFTIEPPFSDRSGLVTVVAVQGAHTAVQQFLLRAGPAVDPVISFLGGRSIVADGADHAMLVITPQDVRGNPVHDGTVVDVRAERPDGSRQPLTAVVQGALAWIRYPALTVVGRTFVATRVDDATSPVVDVRETAADPVDFTLQAPPPDFTADGRTVRTVRTSVLVDTHQNVLPDGSLVVFLLDGPEGKGRLQASTIAGVAEGHVPAPSRPGTVTVRGWSHGTLSPALSIDFSTELDEIPAVAHWAASRSSIIVDIGRVVGSLGGYLADGTPVKVTVDGPDGLPHDELSLLVDGKVTVDIAAPATTTSVRIEILGHVTPVDVTASAANPVAGATAGAG